MPFDASSRFYQSFKLYCEGLDEFSLDRGVGLSCLNAEQFIDSQVEVLEKSSGLPLPSVLHSQLTRIATHLSGLAKLHYISYMNYLRSGELEMALGCLRRFFDYSLANDEKTPLQYAALNIAALFTRLDYPEEALEAIYQGIPIARDTRDEECLSFLLSWLHRLTKHWDDSTYLNARPTEKQILDSLTNRSEALQQHYLHALSLLRKVKWGLENGKPPAYVFQALQIAESVVTLNGLDGILSMLELTKSNAWEHYGNKHMATMSLRQVLEGHFTAATSEDVSLAYAQMAYYEASEGRFSESISLLTEAKKRFPVIGSFEASKYWIKAFGFILFEQHVCHDMHEDAENVVSLVTGHCSANDSQDQAILVTYKALISKQMGRFDEVFLEKNKNIMCNFIVLI